MSLFSIPFMSHLLCFVSLCASSIIPQYIKHRRTSIWLVIIIDALSNHCEIIITIQCSICLNFPCSEMSIGCLCMQSDSEVHPQTFLRCDYDYSAEPKKLYLFTSEIDLMISIVVSIFWCRSICETDVPIMVASRQKTDHQNHRKRRRRAFLSIHPQQKLRARCSLKCGLFMADWLRDRGSSGNHTVSLIPASSVQVHFDKKVFLFFRALFRCMKNRVRGRSSSYGYGLELAGNIPDQSSGMKGNIGVVAYLVKY